MKALSFLIITLLLFASCEHEPVKPKEITTVNTEDNSVENPCDPNQVYFENDILPILVSNCAFSGCHDAGSAQNGVVLTTYSNLVSSDVVEANDLDNSDLYDRITETDLSKRMPKNRPALSNEQITLIRNWILSGAQNSRCNTVSCDTNNMSYSIHIQPIIQNNCVGCHRPQSLGGGIDLSTYNGVKSEAVSLRLLNVITHANGFKKMPLGGNQLPACEINKIRAWINAGSPNN